MRLEFFVPGPLENHANKRAHWSGYAKYRKRWREKTQVLGLKARWENVEWRRTVSGTAPKRVTFDANVWNLYDLDGLQNALKSCRDGLIECGLIDSDAPTSPHRFEYQQRIDRKKRGVMVTVERLP